MSKREEFLDDINQLYSELKRLNCFYKHSGSKLRIPYIDNSKRQEALTLINTFCEKWAGDESFEACASVFLIQNYFDSEEEYWMPSTC